MADESAGTAPGDDFVQSLARGLAVVRAFDGEHRALRLSDIARTTGLTRATTRRLLLTLVRLGYARVDADGRFALTPRVLDLGFAYLSSQSLAEVVEPHLEALSARLGESTSASVLDGADIVYVARVAVRRIMTVGISIGTRFPAHVTSMGRVLLAGSPAPAFDAAVAGLAPAEADRTREAVDRAREAGYALVDQELEAGLRSIAVPVRDRDGAVAAAVNVSSSVAAASVEQLETEYLPALREAATAIESDLARRG